MRAAQASAAQSRTPSSCMPYQAPSLVVLSYLSRAQLRGPIKPLLVKVMHNVELTADVNPKFDFKSSPWHEPSFALLVLLWNETYPCAARFMLVLNSSWISLCSLRSRAKIVLINLP